MFSKKQILGKKGGFHNYFFATNYLLQQNQDLRKNSIWSIQSRSD